MRFGESLESGIFVQNDCLKLSRVRIDARNFSPHSTLWVTALYFPRFCSLILGDNNHHTEHATTIF